jgi:hypothetical protein
LLGCATRGQEGRWTKIAPSPFIVDPAQATFELSRTNRRRGSPSGLAVRVRSGPHRSPVARALASFARSPISSRWARTALARRVLSFVRSRGPFRRNTASVAGSWTPGVSSARREARDPEPAVPSLGPFASSGASLAEVPPPRRSSRPTVRRSSASSPSEAATEARSPGSFVWSGPSEAHLPATFAQS